MAFFGVTQCGYQDTMREHMRNPPSTPQSLYRTGEYRNLTSYSTLPPITPDNSSSSATPGDQVSGYGPGPQGSHKEFTRLKYKSVRNPQGGFQSGLPDVTDVFRRPVTTSQQVARWRVDEPLREREPWTYVKRHKLINSEMTKFVKEMSLTNREFSLF